MHPPVPLDRAQDTDTAGRALAPCAPPIDGELDVRARIGTAVHNVPSPWILGCDRHERVTFVSGGLAAWHGAPAASFVGQSLAQVFGLPAYRRAIAIVAKALSGEEASCVLDLDSRDAQPVRVGATAVPIFNPRESIQGVTLMLHDLDLHAPAAPTPPVAVLPSGPRARVMPDDSSELLSIVSHELRTPINAVLGWASMLSAGVDPATSKRAVEAIARNARALASIVEDLLDETRAIKGGLAIVPGDVSIEELVRAAIEMIAPAAAAKHVRLTSSLPLNRRRLIGDADRLQQAIGNVLSNAVKFTPADGDILVTARSDDRQVEIEVTDTGAGIAPDLLPFVFERYRSGDVDAHRRNGGLGLGLAIAREIVELHGGTIEALSDGLGAGATIRIVLPIDGVAKVRQPSRAAAAQAVVDNQAISLRGVRVAILEERAEARDLMAATLGHYGAIVTTADSVGEAKRLVDRERPDVILVGLGTGASEERGYVFIRWLRSDPAHARSSIPAGALAERVRVDDRTRALAAGFQTHVRAPVNPAELVATVAGLAKLRNGRATA
jgi:signal transduction histidine kinase